MRNTLRWLVCLMIATTALQAQENITFQKPDGPILRLADFDRPPSVWVSGDKNWIIFGYRNTYASLEDLNQDEVKLGGIRINPRTNISSTITYFNNIKIKRVNEKSERSVSGLPENLQMAYMRFSPNDKYLSFTHTTDKGVELWVLDLAAGSARKVHDAILNANLGAPYTWLQNSEGFMVRTFPADRKPLTDIKATLPAGPIVSTGDGSVSQTRTYQDLLKNPQDEFDFEQLIRSELQMLTLQGNLSKFLPADLYIDESLSPDGKYWMITALKKPFSYVVPYQRFPQTTTVYNTQAKQVAVIADIPLDEIRPKGFSSTREGKRSIKWRPDQAAEIFYVEALDGGDASREVEYRDEIYTWKAPFDAPAKAFAKTANRYGGAQWINENYAIVYDSWYDTRQRRAFLVNPATRETLRTLEDRNYQDVYSDPGSFYTTKNQYNQNVVFLDNDVAYRIGDGYTKDGQFPFVDSYNFKNDKTTRLYTSKTAGKKEEISTFLNPAKGDLLVRIESPTDFPNYYIRNLKNKRLQAVTQFENPFASLAGVHKEVITYNREDGVELSGTLYLPAGYDMKNKPKLPLLVWAYPREYKDKNTAGQITSNPNDFTFPFYGSFIYWVTKGYAVLDDAAFPIVGEGTTEPNDTFIEQLLANGKAAIDAVDRLGYIDRSRVAVGGHSYGAFMTANLLTHGEDFKCGIARSGAYNRTLTPFGFQTEQRNYWDNPDIYNTMSPFMNAHKMKKPMLLVHGEADNNPGTFTLQTERYFQALRNLGAPVRMVILPKESHGYRAKENILHLLWEQDRFLEQCLKN
ncbi:MAG: prolyl oligopeptidase family serine peptidase [Weeksellaceae bacterium]|nr:prolyl oligopeptidase family serine peptidase [Weeksellaceae bacterium]